MYKYITGAPPKYTSKEELQAKISDYFENGVRKRPAIVDGKRIEIPIPTITGLVLHCGFANRASFYDYEKKSEFTHTIKMARSFIELEYEENLRSGNVAGSIFALKNFGWEDKQSVDMDLTIELVDYSEDKTAV